MKRIYLLMLAVTSLLLATSCTPSDEEESTALQLSETEVSFSSEAAEVAINVFTDEKNWSVIGSADWIDVVREGDTFMIKVKENKTVEARTGKALVVAGNANATVYIEQKASQTKAEIKEGVLSFNQYANEYVVDIDANSKEWGITTDSNWFTVVPKPFKGELLIKVQENEDRLDRTGKIILNIGGDLNKEILVKQDGIMFFILPYTNIGCGVKEIKKFEKARHSVLFMQPEGSNRYFWGFRTESPLFDRLDYGVDKGEYVLSRVYISSRTQFEKEYTNFMVFMTEQGFVQETENVLISEKLEIKATINLGGTKPYILYQYAPKQPKAYPTFTHFPYGYRSWGMLKPNIDKYEEDHGGVFNNKASKVDVPDKVFDFLYYDVKSDDKEAPTSRTYFVFKQPYKNYVRGLGQTAQYFSNVNLGAFRGKDKMFYLTKEFKALCEKEGFVFVGKNDQGYSKFENSRKNLGMLVIAAQFEGEKVPTLDIRIFPLNSNNSSSAKVNNAVVFPSKRLTKFGL